MKLTDFLNSINHTKEDLFKDDSEHAAKAYQPFVVNRSLSYFPDTIFHSNEMNMLHGIDEKMQYDYLKYSVRKRKRFSKWVKSEKIDSIDLIKDYFGHKLLPLILISPFVLFRHQLPLCCHSPLSKSYSFFFFR